MPNAGSSPRFDLQQRIDRRRFLQWSTAAGLTALCPGLIKAATEKERYLAFHCPKVGETLSVIYWTPTEGYLNDSLREINFTLRDHHDNTVKAIDLNLIDQLYLLQSLLQPRNPFHVICGYRSPTTNARLRQTMKGVARNSYHMYGKAIDVRQHNGSATALRKAAVALKAGGVGYYPNSQFVHLDTGPVRYW